MSELRNKSMPSTESLLFIILVVAMAILFLEMSDRFSRNGAERVEDEAAINKLIVPIKDYEYAYIDTGDGEVQKILMKDVQEIYIAGLINKRISGLQNEVVELKSEIKALRKELKK